MYVKFYSSLAAVVVAMCALSGCAKKVVSNDGQGQPVQNTVAVKKAGCCHTS
jgi:hypothetical protein